MPVKFLTDDELVDLIRLSDDEAYKALFKKYNRNSYYIAKAFVVAYPESGISLDALHNVALEAFFTALKKYSGKETFYPYWYTIAENSIKAYMHENSYEGKASQFVGIDSLDRLIGDKQNTTLGDEYGVEDDFITNYGNDYLTRMAESGASFRQIEKDLIQLLVDNYPVEEILKILDIDKTRFQSIIRSIKRKLTVVKNHH